MTAKTTSTKNIAARDCPGLSSKDILARPRNTQGGDGALCSFDYGQRFAVSSQPAARAVCGVAFTAGC